MPKTKHDYLDALAGHLMAEGLSGASLRNLARAAGTSDRMLIYHFGSKDALVADTLAHIAERTKQALAMTLPGEPSFREMFAATSSPLLTPAFSIWQELVAGAARGDETLRAAGEAIGGDFLDWFAARLGERAHLAPLALAVLDGAAELRAVGHDRAATDAQEAFFALLGE